MKTLKFLLTAFVTAFILLIPAAALSETDDGMVYSIEEDGTVLIEGYKTCAYNVVVPSEIEGREVRRIKIAAFCSNQNITSVTVPDTVTDIGELAFSDCPNLRRVVLGAGVTVIPAGAFKYSAALTSVELPAGLLRIEANAFYGCLKLRKLVIPASVEYIGIDAFMSCDDIFLDVSQNAFAAEYAAQYGLNTDFKMSDTYYLIVTACLTVALAAICIAVYLLFKRFKKHGAGH